MRILSPAVAVIWAGPSFAQIPGVGPAAAEPAQASEQDPRIEQARDAFTLGAALARQGQWLDALAAFERSLRLRAHPVTLYNVGYCERALGHFTRARQSFRAALAPPLTPEAGLPADLASEAQGYLAEVERRIVRATVALADPSARVSIDGRPLDREGMYNGRARFVAGTRDAGHAEAPRVNGFELLLDPGHHVFVLSSGGRESVLERDFPAGSTPRIALSNRPLAVRSPSKGPGPARAGKDYTWAVIAYGVGAAGLATGTVFGIATLKEAAALEDACPDKKSCPESSQGDIDAGERSAMISNVGFGVALAGAGVGTWLLLTTKSPREHAEGKPKASIRAHAGLGNITIRGSF